MKYRLRCIDARGWTSIASFVLTLVVLAMMVAWPSLRQDEFFKTIATLLVGTGWISGPVAWSFATTKNSGDLASKNADLIIEQAKASPPITQQKEPHE